MIDDKLISTVKTNFKGREKRRNKRRGGVSDKNFILVC